MTMNLIDDALITRRVPYIGELSTLVPWHVMSQIRSHLVNTTEEMVFKTLDCIGIDPLLEVVAQGSLMSDIAETLDLPAMKVDKWFHSDVSRLEGYQRAKEFASDHHVSEATRRLLSVKTHDSDAMKVAKTQADHLKWVAARKNRDEYGDRVNVKHNGDVGVIFNITTGGHALDHTQKEVIDI